MAASSAGKREYGDKKKKEELSAGRVWAVRFDQITARSRLTGVLKLTKRLFI
jgi:hypothetical protein